MNTSMWLGLNDRDDDGAWEWSSGEEAAYRAWAEGEPSEEEGHLCAYVSKHPDTGEFEWKASSCFRFRVYVCETPLPGGG